MEGKFIIEVSTHSGEVDVIDLDKYNPDEMVAKLNDSDIQAVTIGDYVYSRIDVRNIRPVSKEFSEKA